MELVADSTEAETSLSGNASFMSLDGIVVGVLIFANSDSNSLTLLVSFSISSTEAFTFKPFFNVSVNPFADTEISSSLETMVFNCSITPDKSLLLPNKSPRIPFSERLFSARPN